MDWSRLRKQQVPAVELAFGCTEQKSNGQPPLSASIRCTSVLDRQRLSSDCTSREGRRDRMCGRIRSCSSIMEERRAFRE